MIVGVPDREITTNVATMREQRGNGTTIRLSRSIILSGLVRPLWSCWYILAYRARFNDARFFWETDQKKKLADRVEGS